MGRSIATTIARHATSAQHRVRGGRGVIVPLVGAKTRARLDDNLGCLDVELPVE